MQGALSLHIHHNHNPSQPVPVPVPWGLVVTALRGPRTVPSGLACEKQTPTTEQWKQRQGQSMQKGTPTLTLHRGTVTFFKALEINDFSVLF